MLISCKTLFVDLSTVGFAPLEPWLDHTDRIAHGLLGGRDGGRARDGPRERHRYVRSRRKNRYVRSSAVVCKKPKRQNRGKTKFGRFFDLWENDVKRWFFPPNLQRAKVVAMRGLPGSKVLLQVQPTENSPKGKDRLSTTNVIDTLGFCFDISDFWIASKSKCPLENVGMSVACWWLSHPSEKHARQIG